MKQARQQLDAALGPIKEAFWRLDELADHARKLQLIDLADGHAIYQDDLDAVFDSIPSLIIVKLSALIDELIDALWRHSFPQIEPRHVQMATRITVLAELHTDFDREAVTALRALRHECAHQPLKNATWELLDRHMLEMVPVVLLI